jgi:WD40 repeat protein
MRGLVHTKERLQTSTGGVRRTTARIFSIIFCSAIALAFGAKRGAGTAETQPEMAKAEPVGTRFEKLRELKLPAVRVLDLSFSPDGRTLLAASGVEEITKFHTWTLPDFRSHYDLIREFRVGGYAFSADSKLLVVGTGPSGGSVVAAFGELSFWDVLTGKMHGKPRPVLDGVTSLKCSPDGKTIALGGSGGEARLFDYNALLHGRTKKEVGGFLEPDNRLRHTEQNGGIPIVRLVAFSPDGGSLATVSENDSLIIWDTNVNRIRYRVKDAVSYLAFSPKGDLLAIGVVRDDNGGSICRILSVKNGNRLGEVPAPNYPSLAFSNDGKLLATGSVRIVSTVKGTNEIRGEVKIWELKSFRLVQTLDSSAIAPVAFSPKEGLLATATKLGSVALWKVPGGK